jgi:hypothetical protein
VPRVLTLCKRNSQKIRIVYNNRGFNGAVREDRTPDLTLTKGVLYH